jgi:hypothetical protein
VGFRLDHALPVNDILDSCGDWCSAMTAAGARLLELGPQGYCYRRHDDNAHWRLPSEVFVRRSWGSSEFFGELPVEAVDGAPSPLRRQNVPSDAELFAALRAS